MRQVAKTDANQAEIMEALRKIGCSVESMHQVGKGFPDLVVGYRGKTYLMEIKTDKGRLTSQQKDFQTFWRGSPVHVVRSVDEALGAIND